MRWRAMLARTTMSLVLACIFHGVAGEGEEEEVGGGPLSPPLCSSSAEAGGVGGVCWVVQVSDLHLSVSKPGREADLHAWTGDVLRAVRPSAVVITGDLTHSVAPGNGMAEPVAGEFEAYAGVARRMADAAGLSASDVLDMRGNHDIYSVVRGDMLSDGYCNHSSAAAAAPGFACAEQRFASRCYPSDSSCLLRVTTADWTPHHGLGGFLNFLGEAPDRLVEALDGALGPARAGPGEVSLAFGHYPLNTLTAGSRDGRGAVLDVLRAKGVAAYMGGHLHRFGKLHRQHERARVLELVLPDWKNNRFYRVLAADGGVVSYVDVQYPLAREREGPAGRAPVMLVTSPPDVRHNSLEALQASRAGWCRAGGDEGVLPVRALVFEREGGEPLKRVQGEVMCGGEVVLQIPLRVARDALYEGTLPARRAQELARECKGDKALALSVSGETSTGRRFVGGQEVPLSAEAVEALLSVCRGDEPGGDGGYLLPEQVGWLSGVAMRMSCHDALSIAAPVSYLLCVSLLLLIPRVLGPPPSERSSGTSLLVTALDDLRDSATVTWLWIAQVAFASAVAFGPVIFLAEAAPGVFIAVGMGCMRELPVRSGPATLASALSGAWNLIGAPCSRTPEAAWILVPGFWFGVWVPLTLWMSQCSALLKCRNHSQWGRQSIQLAAIAVLNGNLLSRGTQQCGRIFFACNLLTLAMPLAALGLAVQAHSVHRLKSV